MSDQNKPYNPTANGTDTTIVTMQEQSTEAMKPVDTLASVEPLPPSIPPETPFDEHSTGKNNRPKWMIPTIATVCVIAIIVAFIIGWYVTDARKKLDAAHADCTTSMKLAADAKTAWTNLLSKDTTVTASKITDKQVADATVVSQLKTAMTGNSIKDRIDCSTTTDTNGLQQVAEQNRTIADAYKKQTTTLSTMVKTVMDSQQKKTLLDTQTILNSKLEEARKLLTDSDGKVQDDKTRTTLSDAINNATKNKTSTNIDQLNKLINTLTTAIQTVNDSVTAKQQADEEARKQAEAAQQAAQLAAAEAQANQSQNYSNQQNYNQYYTTPETTTTPSPPHTSPSPSPTPTPSTPSQKNDTDPEWIGCNAFESPTGTCETDWY